MRFDIFFSICQTPVDGYCPSEAEMFRNFFDQVRVADRLGYETAWIAESHLSSQVQKQTSMPVVPHWEGEIGLNVDFLQLSHKVFQQTERIETGSAIMNIICNGGPIAAAERINAFLALHGLDPSEQRKINVGFAYGRFEFMNRAHGIRPRTALEEAAWPALKGQILKEAGEIFVRLLSGETLSSDQVGKTVLTREHFRKESDWEKVFALAGTDRVPIENRWDFEVLKVIPADVRRDLLQLIVGSHDPAVQTYVNQWAPVRVFNLSITRPEVIEATHARMADHYHPTGGPWKRHYMPRTVFVFLNDEPNLSPAARSQAARQEAEAALGAYWKALQGTIDPEKVSKAADNALVGNVDEVAAQVRERFHPDERLMLWFDFFNHDNDRVIRNMEAFMERVVPQLGGAG